jgi:2',3'-cyclic-nucleotide 2'-phosphodiesterase (5'-nucleotidase family)
VNLNKIWYYLLLMSLQAATSSCTSTYLQHSRTASVTQLDPVRGIETDSASFFLASSYRDSLNVSMNEILAYSDQSMSKGTPESLLGNFVADIVFSTATELYSDKDTNLPDFCLLNNGGLRTSLASGPVLLRHVYELMPFDNEIVVVELSGDSVHSLFRYLADRKGAPVSGLRIQLGDTAWTSAMIQGKPFDSTRTYRVVTSDYLARGGDGMSFFDTPVSYTSTGIKIREALIDYLRTKGGSGQTIHVELDERIRVL